MISFTNPPAMSLFLEVKDIVAFRGTPGERVTVTPQSFRMPVDMPNRVDHVMSGGTTINVAGLEGASQATVERAVEAMIELQDTALKRIMRKYGVR